VLVVVGQLVSIELAEVGLCRWLGFFLLRRFNLRGNSWLCGSISNPRPSSIPSIVS
jgi:hypothetical protein